MTVAELIAALQHAIAEGLPPDAPVFMDDSEQGPSEITRASAGSDGMYLY